VDEETAQAITDWHYWVAQGRQATNENTPRVGLKAGSSYGEVPALPQRDEVSVVRIEQPEGRFILQTKEGSKGWLTPLDELGVLCPSSPRQNFSQTSLWPNVITR
jgi:hypothetical protein